MDERDSEHDTLQLNQTTLEAIIDGVVAKLWSDGPSGSAAASLPGTSRDRGKGILSPAAYAAQPGLRAWR